MSLEEMRNKIDTVDEKIVKLIAQRIKQSQAIGDEKQKSRKPIEDANREKKVLAHIEALAREENLDEKEILGIYRQIIKSSKVVQGWWWPSRVKSGLTAKRRFFNISDILPAPNPVKVLNLFSNWWNRVKLLSG
jgi:chorismate mutase